MGERTDARLRRHGLQKARRACGVVLSLLFGVGLLVLAAPPARAVDVPGFDVCEKESPVADPPSTGVIGVLGEMPNTIAPRTDVDHLWSSGGFSGFYSTPYDLGCASNPASYLKLATASADSSTTNTLVAFSHAVTSIADSIDRRAWNPSWLKEFLGQFASDLTSVITNEVLLPLITLGTIGGSLMMLIRFRAGDVAGAAQGVAWVFVVLTVGGFLIVAPSWAATTSQSAGAGAVAALNGGKNASDAATDRTVEAVHYQSWLRRTFGSDQTEVGKKYGEAILDAQRITWAEFRQVEGDPQQFEALRRYKAKQFADLAAKVKAEDPGAYQWLTREKEGSGIALVEAAFALAAGFFRICVDLLLIMCVIGLVFLACFWLALMPFLVTPAGRGLGVGLLNTGVRMVGYVLIAAIGSWMFGVYLQAALQPGQSVWWSIVLLLVGTVIAWTLIRPDRKALSLMTMGRVSGQGRLLKLLTGLGLSYLSGSVAGRKAAERMDREFPIHTPPAPATPAEEVQPVQYVRATEPAPPGTSALGGQSEEEPLEGEVVWEVPRLPSGPIYQRPDESTHVPTPPPAGSVGEVVLYQRRPTSEHPDDQFVSCPWCRGSGCERCEHEGVVPKWIKDQVDPT